MDSMGKWEKRVESVETRGELIFLDFHFIVPLLCKFFVYLQSLFFVRELLLHF